MVQCEVLRARIEVRRSIAAYRNRPGSGGQVDAVGQVEDIGAELKSEPLLDGDVLDDGQIHILEVGTVELVSAEVAVD